LRLWISNFLRSPAFLMLIGGTGTLVLFIVVVTLLWRTGGAKLVSDNAALIGAMVTLGGVFTAQMVSIALDDRRNQESRDLEKQRAQDDASQAYLDEMSLLLLDKDRPLRQSTEGDEVRTLARARTLTVLPRLDGAEKANVVEFLYESDLITKDTFLVDLHQSDLRKAGLSGAYLRNSNLSSAFLNYADLSKADLRGANLNYADLSKADLSGADLSGADLFGATLSGATLNDADLREANLRKADLRGADLTGADLREANLREADLSSAFLNEVILNEAHLCNSNLSRAFLTSANLNKADLSEADLRETDLRGADLFGATLSEAHLSKANLRDAQSWTEQQLLSAYSLQGAIMPNGQMLKSDDNPDGPTLKEWLKGGGEAGDNA
jgi:uncharacterized protein YjbI with pentapeptide repeats